VPTETLKLDIHQLFHSVFFYH